MGGEEHVEPLAEALEEGADQVGRVVNRQGDEQLEKQEEMGLIDLRRLAKI